MGYCLTLYNGGSQDVGRALSARPMGCASSRSRAQTVPGELLCSKQPASSAQGLVTDEGCAAADPPSQRPVSRQPAPPAEPNEIRFTYTELAGGTANFTPSLVLGEGGFGKCYKGHVRHQEVAIKLLDRLGQQVSTAP